jgi:hypothetical protein
LVVPAILMIDADLRRAMAALRKAARPRSAMVRLRRVALPGVLGLYAVVMVPVLWLGHLPGWLVALFPMASDLPGPIALAIFLAATAVLIGGLWVAGPGSRRKAKPQAY